MLIILSVILIYLIRNYYPVVTIGIFVGVAIVFSIVYDRVGPTTVMSSTFFLVAYYLVIYIYGRLHYGRRENNIAEKKKKAEKQAAHEHSQDIEDQRLDKNRQAMEIIENSSIDGFYNPNIEPLIDMNNPVEDSDQYRDKLQRQFGFFNQQYDNLNHADPIDGYNHFLNECYKIRTYINNINRAKLFSTPLQMEGYFQKLIDEGNSKYFRNNANVDIFYKNGVDSVYKYLMNNKFADDIIIKDLNFLPQYISADSRDDSMDYAVINPSGIFIIKVLCRDRANVAIDSNGFDNFTGENFVGELSDFTRTLVTVKQHDPHVSGFASSIWVYQTVVNANLKANFRSQYKGALNIQNSSTVIEFLHNQQVRLHPDQPKKILQAFKDNINTVYTQDYGNYLFRDNIEPTVDLVHNYYNVLRQINDLL